MFCAICVEDIVGEPVPFVDEGKRFNICQTCATERAREGHGIERGYEGAGPSLDARTAQRGMQRAMGAAYKHSRAVTERWAQAPSAKLPQAEVDLRAIEHDNVQRIRARSVHGPNQRRNHLGRESRKRIGRVK